MTKAKLERTSISGTTHEIAQLKVWADKHGLSVSRFTLDAAAAYAKAENDSDDQAEHIQERIQSIYQSSLRMEKALNSALASANDSADDHADDERVLEYLQTLADHQKELMDGLQAQLEASVQTQVEKSVQNMERRLMQSLQPASKQTKDMGFAERFMRKMQL